MLGRLYIQLHKDSQAEAEIRRALELDAKERPSPPEPGADSNQSNNLAEAEETYKRLCFPIRVISLFTGFSCSSRGGGCCRCRVSTAGQSRSGRP